MYTTYTVDGYPDSSPPPLRFVPPFLLDALSLFPYHVFGVDFNGIESELFLADTLERTRPLWKIRISLHPLEAVDMNQRTVALVCVV